MATTAGNSADPGVGEASEEALEGIDACDGPLPLFHAAALRRASKLVGLSISVPSSLAMTQPRRLLLECSMAESGRGEVVAAAAMMAYCQVNQPRWIRARLWERLSEKETGVVVYADGCAVLL